MFLLFERTGEEFFRTKSRTKRSWRFYLGIKALNDLFPDGTVPYNNWQRGTNLSRFSLSPHCVIWRSFPPGVLFGRPANTFPQPFIKPHAGQANGRPIWAKSLNVRRREASFLSIWPPELMLVRTLVLTWNPGFWALERDRPCPTVEARCVRNGWQLKNLPLDALVLLQSEREGSPIRRRIRVKTAVGFKIQAEQKWHMGQYVLHFHGLYFHGIVRAQLYHQTTLSFVCTDYSCINYLARTP